MKQCSGCKILIYCGQACQKEHWKKVHKQHCKIIKNREDSADKDIEEDNFDSVLKEDKRFNMTGIKGVQNPLEGSVDLLDEKLAELSDLSLINTGVNKVIRKMRMLYWRSALLFGNSRGNITFFLMEIFRDEQKELAKDVFSKINDYDVSFIFNLQLLMLAGDYSVACRINTDTLKESDGEVYEVIKKRKEEAEQFFSCWENFSNGSDFLLLSKSKRFLLKSQTLDSCIICGTFVSELSMTANWDCLKEKTSDFFRASLEDCPPFFRMIEGLGSMACCGKFGCNLEVFRMFENNMAELKLMLEIVRDRPDFVFFCDFCLRRGSVHRCSVCKSRWYCGAECQVQDWKMVHREICLELRKGENKKINSDQRREVARKLTDENKKDYEEEMEDIVKNMMNTMK